jgi:hypothetical protein
MILRAREFFGCDREGSGLDVELVADDKGTLSRDIDFLSYTALETINIKSVEQSLEPLHRLGMRHPPTKITLDFSRLTWASLPGWKSIPNYLSLSFLKQVQHVLLFTTGTNLK